MRLSQKQSFLACVSLIALATMWSHEARAVPVVISSDTGVPIILGADALTFSDSAQINVNNPVGAVVTIGGNGATLDTSDANETAAITTSGTTAGGAVIDIIAGGTNATITNATWKNITEASGVNQPVIQVNAADATINNNNGARIESNSSGAVINLLSGATGFYINNNFGNIINSGSGKAIAIANGATGTIDNTQGTITGAIDNSANASSITLNLDGNLFGVIVGDVKFGTGSDILNAADDATIGTVFGGTGGKGTVNLTSGVADAVAIGSGTNVAAINISADAQLSVTGVVSATQIALANTGELTSGSALTTSGVTFSGSGAGILTLGGNSSGSSVTAVTTTGGNNTGTINVRNTSGTNTFGTIGASGAAIQALNVTGSGGMTDVTGAIHVTNTSLSSGATLRVAALNILSVIDGVSDGVGTLIANGNSGVTGVIGGAHRLAAITINSGHYLTTNNDASATAFSIGTGSQLSAGGNVTATTITVTAANSNLFMNGSGKTLAGNIVTTGGGSNGYGYLYIGGTGNTLSGQIGSSTDDRLYMASIANSGTTTASNVLNMNYLALGNGTLSLTKAEGGSDISAISAGGAGTGILNLSNTSGTNTLGAVGWNLPINQLNLTGSGGTTKITGDVKALTTNIGSGAKLEESGSNSITGSVVNNGTLSLGANAVTIVGNITGTNGTITTTVGASSAGHIVNTNTSNTANATFTNALTVTPTVSSGVFVRNNDKVVLIYGNTSKETVDPSAISTVTSSGFLSWTLSAGIMGTDRYGVSFSTKDVVLIASRASVGTLDGVTDNAAGMIDNLNDYSGSNADVIILRSTVEELSTAAEINKAGAQLAAETNDGTRTATLETVKTVMNTLEARNDFVRNAQIAKSGISSGETFNGGGYWAQGFGAVISQGSRKGVNGYNSITGGAAFGGDVSLLKDVRVGALFAYANTDVNETGARHGSGRIVNSNIGTLYGTYTGTPWYIDAALTFGLHHYDSTRLINSLGSTMEAKGSYMGRQYGVSTEVGYPVLINDAVVTPFVSAAYNYLDQDGYTETGASGANLTVDSRDASSFRSGLGAKVSASFDLNKEWIISPGARAVWLHEFNPKNHSTTTSYAGGSSFTTPGLKLATEAAVVGFSVDLKSIYNSTFSAKYDAELRNKFVGHNFMIQIRSEF